MATNRVILLAVKGFMYFVFLLLPQFDINAAISAVEYNIIY